MLASTSSKVASVSSPQTVPSGNLMTPLWFSTPINQPSLPSTPVKVVNVEMKGEEGGGGVIFLSVFYLFVCFLFSFLGNGGFE
jgi:hypothetical protein